MKKLKVFTAIAAVLILMLTCVSVFAGTLTTMDFRGDITICRYSDGGVLIVQSGYPCPSHN